jgi:subtilisin
MNEVYLVLLAAGHAQAAVEALETEAGITAAVAAEWEGGAVAADHLAEGGVIFDRLGVAAVRADPEQASALGRALGGGNVLAVERERAVGVLPADAVAGVAAAIDPDESEVTWGLQVTGVAGSRATGTGVGVAVLDTGLDLEHPDFAGRAVSGRSFVAGERVGDGHGHGTHCAGTACGPARPARPPRYGVAPEAELYAGKVLSDDGRGVDRSILAGLNWAVSNRCRVGSLSVGAPVRAGERYSQVFEQAARRALDQGTLLVAAAGNDSRRDVGSFRPVAHPANCPSIVAVGALDRRLAVAPFSNRGLDPAGGQVDVAAPGVDVLSSWPGPRRYRRLSGTSMATPHVAGIAALHAGNDLRSPARALLGLVRARARRLPLPAADAGAGLVQAP